MNVVEYLDKYPITERERDLLEYVTRFKEVNGYAPTIKEIQIGINTKSSYHIGVMLEDLKDKGYITYKPNKARTIRILKFIK